MSDGNLRVLIVDDEAPARERLRRLVDEIEDFEVVGEADNGEEALNRCADADPDIVLLDVRMPGMSGLEAARHLSALEEPPAVIFTTAYDEHALEAFETQAIGYVLKPVRREKLARALRHAGRISVPRLARLADVAQLPKRRDQICARLGEQLRLIPVGDIFYFLAGQKYVTVFHRGGQDLIDEPLKALGEEFSPEFIRIHRNALVAEQFISAVERGDDAQCVVRMRDCGHVLQVSRRHAGELLRRIRGEN